MLMEKQLSTKLNHRYEKETLFRVWSIYINFLYLCSQI